MRGDKKGSGDIVCYNLATSRNDGIGGGEKKRNSSRDWVGVGL